MKRYYRRIIILITIITMTVFSSSCGISSVFVALNNLTGQIINGQNNETEENTTESLLEETSETNSEATTVAEETTEETTIGSTTTAGTTGIVNSDNVEVANTPAVSVVEAPTVTDISAPQDYTEEQANSASSVVASINPSDAYSAVISYHNWIISRTFYTTDLTYNNADGVFLYGQSACLGYSLAFEALMDEWSSLHPEFGVECVVAYGDNDTSTPRIGHAWNMVKIGGAWYHVDVTWDDNGSTSIYDYFLMPDSVISQSRVTYYIDNFLSVPAATSTAYVFNLKDQGIPTTSMLTSLTQFSDTYFALLEAGTKSATFYYPSNEDLSNIKITSKVWIKLSQLGYSSVNIRYNNYTLYSNGTYTNYYYFTIIPQA